MRAASFFAGRSSHDVAPVIYDSELRGRVNGYSYSEWLLARDRLDSQASRRDWRAAR
jgi:hypothetical protein